MADPAPIANASLHPPELLVTARTPQRDQQALSAAHFALNIFNKDRARKKRNKAPAKDRKADMLQSVELKAVSKPDSITTTSGSLVVGEGFTSATTSFPAPTTSSEKLSFDNAGTLSPKTQAMEGNREVWPGSYPSVKSPLQSMFEGEWPRKLDPSTGALQLSNCGVGFTEDESLVCQVWTNPTRC